jgi:general L-amino acid transport system permease protein
MKPSETEELKPPATEVGILGWMKHHLFNGAFSSISTIVVFLVAVKLVPPIIQWAFIDSVWFTSGKECYEVSGACWSVVTQNIRFNIFGYFPYAEHWRPLVAMLILFGMLYNSRDWQNWHRKLGYAWVIALFTMAYLMKGGGLSYYIISLLVLVCILTYDSEKQLWLKRAGLLCLIIAAVVLISMGILGTLAYFEFSGFYFDELSSVPTTKWSGLPLTLLLSFFGILASYPLGVMLALGRQSKMPIIKSLCVVYIELIRGVPLITMLFMSSVMFPLFLPEGVTIDVVLRAQVAIILFTAAYIAEVVRGGLQAIDSGQYEAAESLGLPYYQKMRLIILPQALKIVIPPSVGILISAFKDTSLVVIIGLFDILNTTKTILTEPEWTGFSTEAYIFIALIYYVCCLTMSQYSRRIEKELEYHADV